MVEPSGAKGKRYSPPRLTLVPFRRFPAAKTFSRPIDA
jgi:hypothetical protein